MWAEIKNNNSMESEKKKFDLNEEAVIIDVEDEVIDKVLTGEITHVVVDINDDNYRQILENEDGTIAVKTEKMPESFYGINYYNGGVFPYVINSELDFLMLKGTKDVCLTQIIDVNAVPGPRFKYQGPGKPCKKDKNGDCCIWEVELEVVPIVEGARRYLMRWNPAISSFTEKDYEECMENLVHGMFRLKWSIYEWQEARRGDMFFMMRTGDDKAGIVFNGFFLSDPYPADDWAGSTKRRMYVDMVCMNPSEPGDEPQLSLEELQQAVPSFEWSEGHSGVLLSDEVMAQMSQFWQDME